jgi:hypothetical protein
MEIIHRLGAGLAIVACIPSIAAAQGFDERKIRPGQTVLVRDLAGGETKGIVERVDASRLIVKYGVGLVQDPANPTKTLNDTRVFAPAEVDRVRRPDPIWDGAVKGAAVALVPVFVHAECEGCERTGVNALLLGIGAAIGTAIDAACGPRTVYRNRGQSRKVALVPVIGKNRRGLAASIRF